MHESLRDRQSQSGAQLTETPNGTIPASFGNDAAALTAAQTQVALYDRTHWGRIQVGDADRLRFLHNQTTNRFQDRQPGESCDTVFVTSTARTLDLATAYVLDDSVMLLVSPGQAEPLMTWMDRFIFFADKVTLADVTAETAVFSLIGPDSEALLTKLAGRELADMPEGQHRVGQLVNYPVRVARGNGLAIAGYTLITAAEQAADLWALLAEAGAMPMGETVWEALRVTQGRPVPTRELTEDINPLEAGLWHAVSLNKGCYIGQETIARLHTYRGVKQQLWGLKLSAPVDPGTPVTSDGQKVGTLTSVVETPEGCLGLAYLRTKAVENGLNQVHVNDAIADLVPLSFVEHTYPETPK